MHVGRLSSGVPAPRGIATCSELLPLHPQNVPSFLLFALTSPRPGLMPPWGMSSNGDGLGSRVRWPELSLHVLSLAFLILGESHQLPVSQSVKWRY